MGTTLTGTTPQDTYDSLIKVTDNGPLSGTLKALSDGLGNDSALALSTTAASITGSLTTTAKTLAERVQVGTAATLNDATGVGNTLQFANYSPSVFVTASADSYIYKNSNAFGGLTSQSLVFQTRSDTTGGGFAFVAGGTPAVVATITSAGNVGIGTSAPEALLDLYSASGVQLRLANATTGTDATDGTRIYLSGSDLFIVNRENAPIKFFTSDTERFAITNNGVTFNGDTAAANALDDYEEGTFDFGIAFGGASVGVTYSLRGGTYTKIGRQVTVNGLIQLTNKGSSTGNATITGLPFTVANTFGNYSSASLRFSNVTFANQFQAFTAGNTTIIELEEVTEAGVTSSLTNADIADNTVIIVSLTYFV